MQWASDWRVGHESKRLLWFSIKEVCAASWARSAISDANCFAPEIRTNHLKHARESNNGEIAEKKKKDRLGKKEKNNSVNAPAVWLPCRLRGAAAGIDGSFHKPEVFHRSWTKKLPAFWRQKRRENKKETIQRKHRERGSQHATLHDKTPTERACLLAAKL